ncbi:oxidoreductase, short chain dehydrogenase/reductase family protein, partial [Cooperia oncophora]
MLLVILYIYVGYRLCRTIVALIKAIFVYLIAPLFYKPNLMKYANRWTVVTGGTDGIGKAYTIELAKKSLKKFVLIGRNQTKLDDLKSLLEQTYGCSVRTYLFDFDEDDYDKLREYISQIDIGFVLNSVGVSGKIWTASGDKPEEDRQILNVNALGTAEVRNGEFPLDRFVNYVTKFGAIRLRGG